MPPQRQKEVTMPAIDATAIKELLDQVDALKQGIEAAGSEGRAKLRDIKVDDAGRQKAQQEVEVRARETATRRAEVAVAELTASVAALGAIRTIGLGPTESVVLLMVTLLGALGGSLHLLSSLTKYIGNRQLKRRWLLYYLSLPLAGAALAPVVYMLLRVGILAPPGATSEGSQVANLNLIGIYAFAAMTGMFAKTATDKLGEVFKTVFRTDQTTKDTIGADRPAVPRPATT